MESKAPTSIHQENDETKKRDAPGWGEQGPVCWKCKGTGQKAAKKKFQEAIACSVCSGTGRIAKKKLRATKERPPRQLPEGYVIPGPICPANPIEIDPAVEELCALLGHWKILQSLKGGHRWSTDDLLTAWVACREAKEKPIKNHVDLGCGIGTVLLMTSWFFHAQKPIGVGIEAQSTSAQRAMRSIRYNGIEDRLSVVEADFRDVNATNLGTNEFDLITGTPPYFPVDFSTSKAVPAYGGMPTHEQSAPARFEFRGGIEGYVATASKFVKRPDGIVVLCEGNLSVPPKHLDRIRKASELSGLRLVKSVMVHGREDKPALFAVHVLRPSECSQATEFDEERFVVRHVGGKRTEEYLSMCQEMGITPFTDAPGEQQVLTGDESGDADAAKRTNDPDVHST